jgi:small subunit ribosomal protein S20
MATSVSAKKRVRQNQKRRESNRATRSKLRTVLKKAREAAATKPKDAATEQAYRLATRELDKSVRRGMVKRNAASRIKSRLALLRNRSGS